MDRDKRRSVYESRRVGQELEENRRFYPRRRSGFDSSQMTQFDGLWRNPAFLRFWAADTVSVFGSLVTRIALPFTAILMLDAHRLGG
jgi:hypothetical protein